MRERILANTRQAGITPKPDTRQTITISKGILADARQRTLCKGYIRQVRALIERISANAFQTTVFPKRYSRQT